MRLKVFTIKEYHPWQFSAKLELLLAYSLYFTRLMLVNLSFALLFCLKHNHFQSGMSQDHTVLARVMRTSLYSSMHKQGYQQH